MKKVFIAIAVAAFITALAAPVVFAQDEVVTWGELKCHFNPRCK